MEKIQAALSKSRFRTIRLGYIILILIAGLSITGLVAPEWIYPVENALENYQINDLLNLLLGVPLLLIPILISKKGNSFGFLLWSGGLLYNFYNYLAYSFSLSFQISTIFYALLLGMMVLNFYQVLRIQDPSLIQEKTRKQVPDRFGGWYLTLFGVFFIGRSAAELYSSAASGAALPPAEIGVLIADAVLSLALISGGFLLIRRKPIGYVLGPGLMLAVSALFLGVILLVLVQPLFTGSPLDLEAFLVLIGMGFLFWIPAGFFLAGTVRGVKIHG